MELEFWNFSGMRTKLWSFRCQLFNFCYFFCRSLCLGRQNRILRTHFYKYRHLKCNVNLLSRRTFLTDRGDKPFHRQSRIGDMILLLHGPQLYEKPSNEDENFLSQGFSLMVRGGLRWPDATNSFAHSFALNVILSNAEEAINQAHNLALPDVCTSWSCVIFEAIQLCLEFPRTTNSIFLYQRIIPMKKGVSYLTNNVDDGCSLFKLKFFYLHVDYCCNKYMCLLHTNDPSNFILYSFRHSTELARSAVDRTRKENLKPRKELKFIQVNQQK